ncbi:hypothetical protein [Shimia haliotis]|uniref:hypothetical protein n=1 Tax=Shimia haliotis TaxID=1280847 RepID=UPI001BAEC7AE|nr:hypothetical protein [Shimia haliotis]
MEECRVHPDRVNCLPKSVHNVSVGPYLAFGPACKDDQKKQPSLTGPNVKSPHPI